MKEADYNLKNKMVAPLTLVYLKDGNKVLLLKRKSSKVMFGGKWLGVGGKLEPGEKLVKSAIREFEEETGLKIKNPILRGTYAWVEEKWAGTLYIFVATGYKGKLTDNCDEGILKWHNINNLDDLGGQAEHQKIFLKKMMHDDRYFFSGISIYKDEKIVSHANNESYFLKRQEEIIGMEGKKHKKVILMHSKSANPTEKWYPWFREQMMKREIEVHIPELPDPDNPRISRWLPILKAFSPDEETILIGHARGGVAILRYLERLPEGKKIKKIILLAVNSGSAKYITIQSESIFGFYTENGYDFEKIKSHCSDFVVMHSTDDELVPFEYGKETSDGLNARFIKFKNKGHFGEKDGIVPGLIKEVIKI